MISVATAVPTFGQPMTTLYGHRGKGLYRHAKPPLLGSVVASAVSRCLRDSFIIDQRIDMIVYELFVWVGSDALERRNTASSYRAQRHSLTQQNSIKRQDKIRDEEVH